VISQAFEPLYWLNQVTKILAIPARILRIFLYKTQPGCVGLVRKVDPAPSEQKGKEKFEIKTSKKFKKIMFFETVK
jgi:hypothetical protein